MTFEPVHGVNGNVSGNGNKLRARSLRLRDEVDALVGENAPLFDQNTVEIDVPRDLQVDAEREVLREILTGLLTNAVHHSVPHSPIVVAAVQRIGVLMMAVRCAGGGLASDDLPLVFERGYRGSNGHQSGSGIALNVVRDLVHGLDGRIWAESKWGQTSFVLTLPAATLVNS
jgi:signal transduction histidine kinase